MKDLNMKDGENTAICNKAEKHERKAERDGADYCFVLLVFFCLVVFCLFFTANQPNRVKYKGKTQSMVIHDTFSVLGP